MFIEGNRRVQTRHPVKIQGTKQFLMRNTVCFLHSAVNCRSVTLNYTLLCVYSRHFLLYTSMCLVFCPELLPLTMYS